MTLFDKLLETYPELADNQFEVFRKNVISLRDDSDGEGAYIEKWEYSKPIPSGLKLGK